MRRRKGFTLVEMMVSVAIVILIMSILAQAFHAGLTTFRRLKSTGDMADRLRTAANTIREDLAADHFDGSIRLSDPAFTTRQQNPLWVANSATQPQFTWPREGFFMVKQFAPSTAAYEGSVDGIPSYQAPDPSTGVGSHVLYMTVRLKGNRRENFFTAHVPKNQPAPINSNPTFFLQPNDTRYTDPATVYNNTATVIFGGQWAEVAYFLQPQFDPTGAVRQTANGTKLYTLHRFIRVLVADNHSLNDPTGGVAFQSPTSPNNKFLDFSTRPTASAKMYFNTPMDVTIPGNRALAGLVGNNDPALPPLLFAQDMTVYNMLLSEVVSFDVQLVQAAQVATPTPISPRKGGPPATVFGYPLNATDFVDAPGGVYDSATAAVGLSAIRVTVRIWDLRSQQTRQISILQDL